MNCPYCRKEISDTAIRCRYCRKIIRGKKPHPLAHTLEKAKSGLINALLGGKDSTSCRWSFLDVTLITILITLLLFRDPFGIGKRIIDFLRLHFFIFTKEPKLLHYATIYINTILFKFISLILIVALVKLRRVSFWNSVVFGGKLPASWTWMWVYVAICVVFRYIGEANPLVPNMPLDSIFTEAVIIGNIVIIFSVIFVAPFIEEILFRGFIYPAFNKYMGIYPSIILTSFLFTLAHYPNIKDEYLFMAIIFTLSLVITYARAKTGSTWLAIIMHHIYNLMYIAIGFINYAFVKY